MDGGCGWPGARAALADLTLYNLHDTGLEVLGPATVVSATRATFHRMKPDAQGLYGMGVYVKDASRLDGKSVAVVGAGSAGIAAAGPGFLQLDDSLVRDVDGDGAGTYGFGMLFVNGAGVELNRVAIGPVNSAGIITLDGNAFVSGFSVLIDGVRPERALGRFGQGVAVLPDSRVELTDSVIRSAAVTAGAWAGGGGKLSRCELRSSPVGLYVQDGSALGVGEAPAAPAPAEVWVDEATRFLGVTSNVGVGVVPVPDPTGGVR